MNETRPKWRDSLTLAALGVVYGDIGTSPLYTMNVVFSNDSGLEVSYTNVLGLLSLIFWSLLLVVTLKYMMFVLKADHEGDGGVIALATLLGYGRSMSRSHWLLLGVVASTLLIGDSLLTPAISVLSAMQGLELVSPRLEAYVPELTVVILLLLFTVQRRGTAAIGGLFGPIMAMWYLMLGVTGFTWILDMPTVLQAMNPLHALAFLSNDGWSTFLILGLVFLVVTGSEALYADLGHFGITPIRRTWWYLVWPALTLNYFGQGALLLSHPQHPVNVFFALTPHLLLVPMILFATLATVIASQAVITGAFSLFKQLAELGYFPHLQLKHTSAAQAGRIYVPAANWLMLGGTLLLVFLFQSPEALAGAYGLAIGGVSLITSILFLRYYRVTLGRSTLRASALGALFIGVDGAFLVALLSKLMSGALIIFVICGLLLIVMLTWHWGQRQIDEERLRVSPGIDEFLADEAVATAERTIGTALFLTKDPIGTPLSLLQNFRHNHVLHRENYLVIIEAQDRPRVPLEEKLTVTKLGRGFFSVTFRTGYMELPKFAIIRTLIEQSGYPMATDRLSVFASHTRITPNVSSGLAAWRARLFTVMTRNSPSMAMRLEIPEDELIEIGIPFDL